jgi:predicted DNA-binding transcriptional regulator YafY
VYRVSRIVSARERSEECVRDPEFDLAATWASRSEAFERTREWVDVTVRVPRGEVRYLRGARVVEEGERPTVVAQFDGLDHAFHRLLSYGPDAEVLAPAELRERIASSAARTAALYAGLTSAEELRQSA